MTDTVTEELTEFFDYIWGPEADNAGVNRYVYLPLREDDGSPQGHWTSFMFRWPAQRKAVVQHVLKWNANPKVQVFYSPGLFKRARPIKDNVLGSWVLWVDFDGNAPQDWEAVADEFHIPRPTLIVQSSIEGHEHTYWRLNAFLSDISKLEERNRSLAYVTHADTSGWDADQILRPIHTINRKRDMPVVVKEWS